MVTLHIDGQEVQVPEGTNLVEAARKAGIEVPTYCYHPALRVVGQCRICFVEVEGMPRLVTACSTPVSDEMIVSTSSERVREARAAVMEFLLANHPLDCPVCDQAGECYLQDYSVEHGLDSTHMVDVRRTFPGLERRQIGPHVVQNQNRCIHCTRCIRFTEEIAETRDLTMKMRGNHAFIDTFDGQPFDNPWSACAADVCPVGALTVKEFRFRARVWHLEETDSICPGCSIGCNTRIGHHGGVVHRFVPRPNLEVNGWWMCDYGRSLAEDLNRRDVSTPLRGCGEERRAIELSEAIATLRELLAAGAGRVVASANLSNEALYLVKKVLEERLGLDVVTPVSAGEPRSVKDGHGDWVEGQDAHPNSTGVGLIGLHTVDEAALKAFVASPVGPLLVLDNRAHPWLLGEEAAEVAKGAEIAVFARVANPLSERASLVLPAASWIETEGSYTSSTGRAQLARRGLFPAGRARPPWEILFLLAAELGMRQPGEIPSPETLFEELAAEIPAFAGMTYRRLATEPGVPILEEVPDVG